MKLKLLIDNKLMDGVKKVAALLLKLKSDDVSAMTSSSQIELC